MLSLLSLALVLFHHVYSSHSRESISLCVCVICLVKLYIFLDVQHFCGYFFSRPLVGECMFEGSFFLQRKDFIPHRIYMEICFVHGTMSLHFSIFFSFSFHRPHCFHFVSLFVIFLLLLLQWMHCAVGLLMVGLWEINARCYLHILSILNWVSYKDILCSCWWVLVYLRAGVSFKLHKNKVCALLFYCLIARPRNPVSLSLSLFAVYVLLHVSLYDVSIVVVAAAVCVSYSKIQCRCGLFGKFVKWYLVHVEWFGKL